MSDAWAAVVCATGLWVIVVAAAHYEPAKPRPGEAWVVTAAEPPDAGPGARALQDRCTVEGQVRECLCLLFRPRPQTIWTLRLWTLRLLMASPLGSVPTLHRGLC